MEEIYDMAEIYEDASRTLSVTTKNEESSLVNLLSSRGSKRDNIIGKEIITSNTRKIDTLRTKVRQLELGIQVRSSCSVKDGSEARSFENRDDASENGVEYEKPIHGSRKGIEGRRDDSLPSIPSIQEILRNQKKNQSEEISKMKNDFRNQLAELQRNHMKQFQEQKLAHDNALVEMEARLVKLLEMEVRKINSKMTPISGEKTIQNETIGTPSTMSSEKIIGSESLCDLEQFSLLEVTDTQRSRIFELQKEVEEVRDILERKNKQLELVSQQDDEISVLKTQLADAKAEVEEKEKRMKDQVEKTRKRDIRITKLRNELSRARRALLKALPPKRSEESAKQQTRYGELQNKKQLELKDELIKARADLKLKGERHANKCSSSDDTKSTASKTCSVSTKDSKTTSIASKAVYQSIIKSELKSFLNGKEILSRYRGNPQKDNYPT